MNTSDRATFCLFGASLETGNLGVSALGLSLLEGFTRRLPGVRFYVFQHGHDASPRLLDSTGPHAIEIRPVSATNSRRLHRRNNLLHIHIAASLGGLGNPAVKAVRDSTAVLDVTGGDSFTDLYGGKVFRAGALRKALALRLKRPLLLLPQTYGPFSSDRTRRVAARLISSAGYAWARDERSFAVLRDLLRECFDPERHRAGVDLAFALEPVAPSRLPEPLAKWLEMGDPVVGLNVSGLIFNSSDAAERRYALRADYPSLIENWMRSVLNDTDMNLLLMPHVAPRNPQAVESDERACRALMARIPRNKRGRVCLGPTFRDPREAKWVISRCVWFCGARMHSTIAALSSGTPCAAVAYSNKTLGVFETCGQGPHVFDLRSDSEASILQSLRASFEDRDAARRSLHESLPDVRRRCERQMDDIVAAALGQTASANGRGVSVSKQEVATA